MNLQSCSQRLHAKTQSVGSASQRRTCVLISKQVTSLPVYQTPVMREHHIAGTLRPSVRPIVKTASSSSSSGRTDDSHAGRAFLHDFCMTIPFSGIAFVAAAVMWFVGGAVKAFAPMTAAVGVATVLTSILSLKNWRNGQQATPFTIVAAGASGYLAYESYLRASIGSTVWLTWPLAAVSGALSLFCVYNILAGGNPPKKGTY